MAEKTGGHWRPCNVSSVEAHNERQKDYLDSVKNSGRKIYLFEHLTKNNSSWVSGDGKYHGKTVAEIFEAEKNLYKEKFGQMPQLAEKKRKNKKTGREEKIAGWSPIREMCPPIKADTKIEDFDYFREWAERNGIKIIRIDLHKDEGYYDEDTGEYKMNYHAHVVGDFLDWETGKTIKHDKEKMSQMQTILAISLGMERGERKKKDTPDYLDHQEYRQMKEELDVMDDKKKEKEKKLEEIDNEIMGKKEYLDEINAEIKTAEKKLKSFTTMLNNLKEKKEHLEIEITALEEMRDTGNEEVEQQLKEKQQLLDEINEKIGERNRQLSDVQDEYDELLTRAVSLETVADNYSQEITQKKSILVKTDKTGEIREAQQHTANAEEVLYRRWPEARKAVKAIFDMTNHPRNTDFTPQQALDVEHAIVTSGTSRTDAANDLMLLAKKDFDHSGTFSGRIEKTAEVVQSVANNTHCRLTALLKVQPKNNDGSASYITDLTDWAGNQMKY